MITGKKISVSNIIGHSGNPIANQFEIETSDADYFQSYGSLIAKKTYENNKLVIYLDERYWDYSVTTGKYRNLFLGETKRETEKKIKSGEYILTNLNEGWK
tara:strand:+ start:520 stop:822 length:303 start_codon:yes stop_codon:yes gene_type:complete